MTQRRNEMGTLKLINTSKFALSYNSTNTQLMVHMSNLFTYFHKDNEHIRVMWDAKTVKTPTDVISMLQYLLHNPETRTLEFHRHGDALTFRCNQILNYYGDDAMKLFLFEIYGKVI